MKYYLNVIVQSMGGGFFTSQGSTQAIRIPCESEVALKRLAGEVSRQWAESMQMTQQLTPFGMQMVPSSSSPIIHIAGEHGTVALRVQDIVRIEPVVVTDRASQTPPVPPPYKDSEIWMQMLDPTSGNTVRLFKDEEDDDDNEDG